MTILTDLETKKLIHPPPFLSCNTHYLCVMGSSAYGVSNRDSDLDVYGFCIPPREVVFPHLAGHIDGFGNQKKRFEVWTQHHIHDNDKEYDFSVFNIVRYFHLCMDGNPNMVDSLFVPFTCVLQSTSVGNLVRESRHLFLSKLMFPKLKGYAYGELSKIKSIKRIGNRKEDTESAGIDLKHSYHVVRLLSQCEQILMYSDLDLQESGRVEHMKAIRRGDLTADEIIKWASEKESQLEGLFITSKLREKPPEKEIKQLLLNCLEHHYGSLEKCIVNPDSSTVALNRIAEICREYFSS